MKSAFLLLFAVCALAAQEAPKPDTVVAIIDGKPVTVAELQAILRLVGPMALQNFQRDPDGFLRQIALMRHLTAEAEKSGLDQKSPFKDQLQWNRQVTLFNAQAQNYFDNLTVSADEQKAFYETNKDRYREVAVKALYVAFSRTPIAGAKKSLTEDEAREKAMRLVKEMRAGADFVKLVKANSDDHASAAKDGDYGVIRKSDKIDEAIHKAIFLLKPGEISDPVRSTNGFYIFRAEKNDYKPYDSVKDDIFIEIKRARQNAYLAEETKKRVIKVDPEALKVFAPK